ncbi:uncharacterized protein LOC141601030 [Silene latifolia]|uniref:uncharacterized protein LOC141601030 n=1 Tax=Silene latifolia TaxID=37657 RepID=UPI003D774C25
MTLLHDMMHKEVEVYVDDMIVKSKEHSGHLEALRKFFERLRKYNMSHCGIEVDPSKIKTIMEMPHPETKKQIRGFLGRVQYISRFVSRLTMICEPIFKKLKAREHEIWDDHCQATFDKIKEVLSTPPVLSPPISRLPLSLYLTVTDTATEAMLAQTNVKMDSHVIRIRSQYVPLKVIKGRVVADFLANNPIEEAEVVDTWSFPDEDMVHIEDDVWDLYFDGALNFMGYGVGILISPKGEHMPVSIKLDFNVTNNAAEYEACLLGLRGALDLGVKKLLVHGDSYLVINQVVGSWKIKSSCLAPYQVRIEELEQYFDDVKYVHLLRDENQFADALSKLAESTC